MAIVICCPLSRIKSIMLNIEDLFRAYYDARKNKRGAVSALAFEVDYEKNLFELYDEIIKSRYKPGESICFISNYPVKREIFAALFRDRIVHHLIYNYISPIFECRFINDSYSCRIGKGVSYGIKRLDHFIRSGSKNYKKDCYILKLDIKGYFMSINRSILFNKIKTALERVYERERARVAPDLLLDLIRQTIFHDPTKNCRIKGRRSGWRGLPKSKSLFYAGLGYGLPIGNLTSQLFGNIYLNDFDHFVKGRLGIKHYGRYVDDIAAVHGDKEYLKKIIPKIKRYLSERLNLDLHEKKIYLQHFSKGVKFLGAVIKPYRIYIANRTKGNFYKKIQYWNNFLAANQDKISREDMGRFLASMNSYLGIMGQYDTYKLRKKMLNQNLPPRFRDYVLAGDDYVKLMKRVWRSV